MEERFYAEYLSSFPKLDVYKSKSDRNHKKNLANNNRSNDVIRDSSFVVGFTFFSLFFFLFFSLRFRQLPGKKKENDEINNDDYKASETPEKKGIPLFDASLFLTPA